MTSAIWFLFENGNDASIPMFVSIEVIILSIFVAVLLIVGICQTFDGKANPNRRCCRKRDPRFFSKVNDSSAVHLRDDKAEFSETKKRTLGFYSEEEDLEHIKEEEKRLEELTRIMKTN